MMLRWNTWPKHLLNQKQIVRMDDDDDEDGELVEWKVEGVG